MRFAIVTAAALTTAFLACGSASAAPMPAAPVAGSSSPLSTPAVSTGTEASVILVRGGCGWGAHRGFYGRCRYNHGWRGRMRYRHGHWYRW